MLPEQTGEQIVFVGGKDYLPLVVSLTSAVAGKKTIFYNSAYPPLAVGCVLKRYETSMRTNWHYQCANAFLDGAIKLT